ncbi:hypothetical protein HRbin28_02682 [bacterium HR28]|nr:hypothetical protein HRbin28_02682 [bacterium HR28]
MDRSGSEYQERPGQDQDTLPIRNPWSGWACIAGTCVIWLNREDYGQFLDQRQPILLQAISTAQTERLGLCIRSVFCCSSTLLVP